jgi:hypothetical protein
MKWTAWTTRQCYISWNARGRYTRVPKTNKTNSVALSPRANYTDWATATCRRNLVPTFVDRRVSRGQRGGSPTVVNLFSRPEPLLFFQVAPHLSSQGLNGSRSRSTATHKIWQRRESNQGPLTTRPQRRSHVCIKHAKYSRTAYQRGQGAWRSRRFMHRQMPIRYRWGGDRAVLGPGPSVKGGAVWSWNRPFAILQLSLIKQSISEIQELMIPNSQLNQDKNNTFIGLKCAHS